MLGYRLASGIASSVSLRRAIQLLWLRVRLRRGLALRLVLQTSTQRPYPRTYILLTIKSPDRVRIVGTDDGPRARPVPARGDGDRKSPEKVIIDPTKGGQIEAKEKTAQAQALNVPEGNWVWGGTVNLLQVDLFRYSSSLSSVQCQCWVELTLDFHSPNWEIRHGAAMALREVIKIRGASGGMRGS